MSKANKIGNAIKHSITKGFQSSCAVSHIALRYGLDGIEYVESTVINKLYPEQDKVDIVKERRNSSNASRLEHQRAYNEFRKQYDEYMSNKFGTAEDVVTETVIHSS